MTDLIKLAQEWHEKSHTAFMPGERDVWLQCSRALEAALAAPVSQLDPSEVAVVIPTDLHPETRQLVASFANALATKLFIAQEKYGFTNGWASNDWMDTCRAELRKHLQKGDPRDVAAYCAFLWYHGESTAAPASQPVTDEMVNRAAMVYVKRMGYVNPNDWAISSMREALEAALGVAPKTPIPCDGNCTHQERGVECSAWTFVAPKTDDPQAASPEARVKQDPTSDEALVAELRDDADKRRREMETANALFKHTQKNIWLRTGQATVDRDDYESTLLECKRWQDAATRIEALNRENAELKATVALRRDLREANAVLAKIRERYDFHRAEEQNRAAKGQAAWSVNHGMIARALKEFVISDVAPVTADEPKPASQESERA